MKDITWPQKRWELARVIPYEGSTITFPYYCQAGAWCWRKPIWVGLPLFVPVLLLGLLADVLSVLIFGPVWLISHWGR